MVNYAIVGGGRLARHFSRYFQLLEIPHTIWARDHRSPLNTLTVANAEQRLRETVTDAPRVLLLVSDTAIATLLRQYPFLHDKQLIHCSGALSFPGVAGVHPLMTFADNTYALDVYRSVPFMVEAGHDFNKLLPGLVNPHFAINVEDKARYHAMCVMAGNFTQILWKGVSDRFGQQLGIPAETLHPYLKQLAVNFIQAPATALTGPLTRNDDQTIGRNLHALGSDPLKDLYQSFIDFYKADSSRDRLGERTLREQVV